MGGGVGGGGSGGMLRTVGRAVTTTRTGVMNLQEPISSSSSSTSTTTSPTSPTAANSRPAHQNRNGGNQLSLSAAAALTASPFGSHNVPVPAHYGVPSWSSFGVGGDGGSSCCYEYEWVSVDGCEKILISLMGFLLMTLLLALFLLLRKLTQQFLLFNSKNFFSLHLFTCLGVHNCVTQ